MVFCLFRAIYLWLSLLVSFIFTRLNVFWHITPELLQHYGFNSHLYLICIVYKKSHFFISINKVLYVKMLGSLFQRSTPIVQPITFCIVLEVIGVSLFSFHLSLSLPSSRDPLSFPFSLAVFKSSITFLAENLKTWWMNK